MKDILVDNTECGRFCNPIDDSYKAFIEWIRDEGVLVVTRQLLKEYKDSATASRQASSLPAIVQRLTTEERLNWVSKKRLNSLRIPKHIENKLRSNRKDHMHLKAVLLSCRRLAISGDARFRYDVNNYPRMKAQAAETPEEVDYRTA